MSIPVFVPWRTDNGHRQQLWSTLRENYWGNEVEMADFDLHWGEHPEHAVGPFNRSAAINYMAGINGDWEIAVIADSDTWVHPCQLRQAITLARRTGRLVAAFTSVIELTEDTTARIVADGITVDPWALGIERVRTEELQIQSSMLVVTRSLWDLIGGFDEKFVSWGAEDNAWWKAATILGGTPLRIDGAAFHLWHPTADRIERLMDPQWRANWARLQRYYAADCECSLRRVQRSN